MKRINYMMFVACAVLAAVTLTACGQKAGAKAEKPESIKLMVDGTFLIAENGEQILVDGFKELTGMDLVLNHPVHNEYYQKVNLAFATGDIPDVVLLGANPYVNYATNGALYDMTELYENSKLKSRIKDPALVQNLYLDGKLYGLPYDRGNGTITYVRGDWLEKLGLEAPKNYDEFINMLRQFKNNNPDGLEPSKVIPLTAAGLVNNEAPLEIYLREFYQDATPDFVKVNGKWVDGMSQPNMAAALQRMRDAYAEGLIDTEIITNKTSTCRDKFYSGTVGVFNYWAGTWNENLHVNLTPNFPDAKVTPIPAIAETKYIERAPTAVSITSKASNPEAIFEYFFERMWDGAEGQMLFTFGVEGKTYEVVDGKIKFLPSIQNPSRAFVKAWFTPDIPVIDWNPNWQPNERITGSLAMFQKDAVQYSLFPASEVMSKLVPELNAIKRNYVANIVYGRTTVEAGIAEYVKEATRYVEAILADINK